MLTKSWHVLSNKTFKIAGISEKEVERICVEEDDPFAGLDDIEEDTVQTLGVDLAVLKERFGDQVDLKITPNEFIDFYIEVATTHGRLSNQEMLADINVDQVDISDNEDDKSVKGEPVAKPGIEEGRNAIKTSENFNLFQNLEKQ